MNTMKAIIVLKNVGNASYRLCSAVAAGVLAILSSFNGSAATITWTNTNPGNWSAVTNWSPQQVPTSADAVILAASATITVDVPAFANSLSINNEAPILGGSGPLTLGGPINWSGGTISTVVYCNGGTVDDPGGLDGGQLINTGTLSWIPYPYTGAGSVISNASTGTINFQLSRTLTANDYGGSSYFYNAGQINGSGAGVGTIGDTFINTGTITVTSGTLEFANGGTNFGTMTANGSGVVGVSGGTFYFTSSSVVSGTGGFVVAGGTANIAAPLNISGSWTFSGGTVNLTGASTASGQTLIISGATVNFTGPGPWLPGAANFSGGLLGGIAPVAASGALNWTGGTISTVVYCNGGTVDDPGGLDGGQLINTGTLSWVPYPFTGGGSVISNAASGTINLPLNNNVITRNGFGGTATFYNSGVINCAGSSTGTLADTFVNNGTLNLQSGTLRDTASCAFGSNSILTIAVTSRTNFASLDVTGGASLGGLLGVISSDGYTPAPGDSLPLITYGSESGLFNAFIFPPYANWQPNCGRTAFTLNVASLTAPYLTLTPLLPKFDSNGFNFLMLGPIGSNYTIQSSSNLQSWTTLTNFVTTYSSFYFTDPSATHSAQNFYRAFFTP
jgi:hypothetical protein